VLTEERHAIILDTVNKNKSVGLNELCQLLYTSESTVRRDLTILDERGLLIKVRGGAIALAENYTVVEHNVEEKSKLFIKEKEAIARFAVSLIHDGDFVFIDAGTTTEKMLNYISAKDVTFVTNAFLHAKKLAQRGFKVFIPAGEIKLSTEAIVGAECLLSLQNYNFTKCFMGVNGISVSGGFSTPDINEASVKTAVINNGQNVYVLADHSKFDKVTAVKFAALNRAKIITDKLEDKKYLTETSVKEVLS